MTSVAQAPTPAAAPASERPTPERILSAFSAHERTAALLAGIELELFTAIGEGATTSEALARRTGAAERGVRILADYLVVDGLLTKHEGSYGLAPDAAAFLDRRSPMYLGSMSRFLGNQDFIRRFGRLVEAVRRGGSVEEKHMVVPEQPLWVEFARGMAPMMAPTAGQVAEAVGRAERVLDLAAGHGLFGIAVGEGQPGRHGRGAGLGGGARRRARERRTGRRGRPVQHAAGERVRGGLRRGIRPGADPQLPSPLRSAHLRRPPAPGARRARAGRAGRDRRVRARPGPGVAADTGGVQPQDAGDHAGGDAYTYAELERMCREAGFTATEMRPLAPAPQSLVIARR